MDELAHLTIPDGTQWQDADAYAYTQNLNLSQWAWQFLRRNPDYQKDWQWFWPVWQALEKDYGSPPARDFKRWKLDTRAWRDLDDERLLIECWMGQRWGFYKFPLDPGVVMPGIELAWRPTENRITRLSAADQDYLDDQPEHIALGFDLDCPLAEQLHAAKKYLITLQRSRQQKGLLRRPQVSAWREHWTRLLRLLDALADQAANADILGSLYAHSSDAATDFDRDSKLASGLRDKGYRTILKYLDHDQVI